MAEYIKLKNVSLALMQSLLKLLPLEQNQGVEEMISQLQVQLQDLRINHRQDLDMIQVRVKVKNQRWENH